MREIRLNQKIWVSSGSIGQSQFKESVNEAGVVSNGLIITGIMMPYNKVSRNGVLYNWDTVVDKHKELIGRPLMFNHDTESSNSIPLGHFTNSWIENDGWHYEADIDPAEIKFINKVRRGDLSKVSIQLMAGNVKEMLDDDGNSYSEAYVDDIIEGSLVPTPGFLDTSAVLVEAFRPKKSDSNENLDDFYEKQADYFIHTLGFSDIKRLILENTSEIDH